MPPNLVEILHAVSGTLRARLRVSTLANRSRDAPAAGGARSSETEGCKTGARKAHACASSASPRTLRRILQDTSTPIVPEATVRLRTGARLGTSETTARLPSRLKTGATRNAREKYLFSTRNFPAHGRGEEGSLCLACALALWMRLWWRQECNLSSPNAITWRVFEVRAVQASVLHCVLCHQNLIYVHRLNMRVSVLFV